MLTVIADGDIEVQRFPALIRDERHLLALDQPHDQRPEHVAERHDEAGQRGQVGGETPLALLGGNSTGRRWRAGADFVHGDVSLVRGGAAGSVRHSRAGGRGVSRIRVCPGPIATPSRSAVCAVPAAGATVRRS